MHEGGAHSILITVVAAIALGVMLIVVARRLSMPAIVLLLAGGVALGPVGIGIVQPSSLGEGMRVLVQLLVGVILFEGGLSLDLNGYRTSARAIGRLLTFGVATTWLVTAVIIYAVTDHGFGFSIITASLVIVTGPTVIGPLLKRIRITDRLHQVLTWEGVLVDPIGVFIALLCFEAIALDYEYVALAHFALRFGVGLMIGVGGGYAIYRALKHEVISTDMAGVGTLACAIALFGVAEALSPEAGLLTVTVAGFVVGYKKPVALEAVRHFKSEITELSIGMLFILLSARLSIDQFYSFGWDGLLVVVAVIFVVRPITILVSTWGPKWNWRERLFLSWVAPRGIVAASMGSLFALELEKLGLPRPRFVETFVYSVIVATIVLQGSTAGWLAKVLKLEAERPRGWAIVGAHSFGRAVAQYLLSAGVTPVVLIDLNRRYLRSAEKMGVRAVAADARDPDKLDRIPERRLIGQLLAITANEELNAVICRRWRRELGEDAIFRWHSGSFTETDPQFGVGIWRNLASPTVIASELDRGDTRLVTSEDVSTDPEPRERLLHVHNGDVTIDLEATVIVGQPKGAPALFLERDVSSLAGSLSPGLVLDIAASERDDALRKLVTAANARSPLPVEELVQDLITREQSFPAALGQGVAVPHAFVEGLDHHVCVFARLETGVDWGAPDEVPVQLVILLLSPPGRNEHHLALLADVARLLISEPMRKRLLAVPKDQLLDTLLGGLR